MTTKVNKVKKTIYAFLLSAVLLSACGTTPEAPTKTPEPIIQHSDLPTLTALPTTETPTQIPSSTPTLVSNSSIMDCKDANGKNGEFVTCKIDKAYCTFNPDVNGDPTFCNDAPYPDHQFTLLFWNQDLTEYDGKCIIISGVVGSFEGKPQIKTRNRARVTYCP